MPTKKKRRPAQDVARPSTPRTSPSFVTPMAAHIVKTLPEGEDWIYELKFDGYRALVLKNGNQLEIRSRNNKDLTQMYRSVAAAGLQLKADQVVIDGEIVVLDEHGRPSFQALQHRGSHAKHQIVFYAFDVLHLNGRDLTRESLVKRRAQLSKLADGAVIRVSHELPGTAAEVVQAVKAMGLEGVVAKRRNSLYEPGARSEDWVKLRLESQQEFVIGGYRPAGPSSVDALFVGYYEGENLRFAGKIRAGLIAHVRRELAIKLKPLHVTKCPFIDLPTTGPSRWGGGVTADEMHEIQWTRPEFVAQIRFAEWTAENRLRHAAFVGLRFDKTARDVHRE